MTDRVTHRSPAGRQRTDSEAGNGERLWLATLQRITARATHELRNAMNGAAVNLEVVRSRSVRADMRNESIGPFAEAAAGQFAATVGMVEALVALARPAYEPLDVAEHLTRLAAVLAPGLRTAGGTLTVEVPRDTAAVTSAPCDLTRAVLGAAMLSAVDGAPTVVCQVTAGSCVIIRIARSGGAPALGDDVRAAAIVAEISVETHHDILTLTLPSRVRDGGGSRTS